eukprot:GHVP01006262.1.p1 GENE.GHVP01006262.1~~GHVP01006262.1.p1  ORF type:complete len:311 (-),score=27.96 GHVP01006262.1:124-1056(-)
MLRGNFTRMEMEETRELLMFLEYVICRLMTDNNIASLIRVLSDMKTSYSITTTHSCIIHRLLFILNKYYIPQPSGFTYQYFLDASSNKQKIKMIDKNNKEYISAILETIKELEEDIVNSDNIEKSLSGIIDKYQDESIIIFGESYLTNNLIRYISKYSNKAIYLITNIYSYNQINLIKDLKSSNIRFNTLPVHSACLLIQNCRKLFIEGNLISPTGNPVGSIGSLSCCLMARKAMIPVYCLIRQYMISPDYNTAVDSNVYQYKNEIKEDDCNNISPFDIVSPSLELVPRKLIDCYITSEGVFDPEMIYLS